MHFLERVGVGSIRERFGDEICDLLEPRAQLRLVLGQPSSVLGDLGDRGAFEVAQPVLADFARYERGVLA